LGRFLLDPLLRPPLPRWLAAMYVNSHAALSGPSLGHLLAQSGIEQMREPHSRLLQLLPDDLGVRVDIGGIDRHFPAMARDSFAQSFGSEWVQLAILAGVIVFIRSVAEQAQT